MHNVFYIMETSPNWYQVRLVKTHFCMSCGGDLNKRLEGITRLVAKYRTEDQLIKMIEATDGSGKLSPATFEQYRAQYSDRGHLYDDDVAIAVSKGLKLRQQNDPIRKAQKRIKPVIKQVVKEETHAKPRLPHFGKKETIAETTPPVKTKIGLLNNKIKRTFR